MRRGTHTYTPTYSNQPISSSTNLFPALEKSTHFFAARGSTPLFGVPVATISAHFPLCAVNSIFSFFSPLFYFFGYRKNKINCYVPFDSVKASLSCARCSSDATGFYDFFVTLRDILEGKKKSVAVISVDGTTHVHTQMDAHARRPYQSIRATNRSAQSRRQTQSCGRGAARTQRHRRCALWEAFASPPAVFPRC